MSKVAMIGAGVVGATIAYAAMMRGVTREIVLVDVKAEKARAEAMDLNHGAMFVPPVTISDGTIEDCRGAEVVIVTAGAKCFDSQLRLRI